MAKERGKDSMDFQLPLSKKERMMSRSKLLAHDAKNVAETAPAAQEKRLKSHQQPLRKARQTREVQPPRKLQPPREAQSPLEHQRPGPVSRRHTGTSNSLGSRRPSAFADSVRISSISRHGDMAGAQAPSTTVSEPRGNDGQEYHTEVEPLLDPKVYTFTSFVGMLFKEAIKAVIILLPLCLLLFCAISFYDAWVEFAMLATVICFLVWDRYLGSPAMFRRDGVGKVVLTKSGWIVLVILIISIGAVSHVVVESMRTYGWVATLRVVPQTAWLLMQNFI